MVVTACVQPSKLVRLRAAMLGTRHHVLPALDWAHADAMIRGRPVDVLIVDPHFDTGNGPHAEAIRSVRYRYRSLPMIVYATLAAQTLRPIIELGSEGMNQLVLFGLDDDPGQLRMLLERQPGVLLAERLLLRLGEPLGLVSGPVAQGIERLIRNPAAFPEIADFVKASGVSRRSLYRYLARAGLALPRPLVLGARLLRAYAYLREPAWSIAAVTAHTGFANPHALSLAMKEIIGVTPGYVRSRIGPELFLDRLVASLVPAPPAASEPFRHS